MAVANLRLSAQRRHHADSVDAFRRHNARQRRGSRQKVPAGPGEIAATARGKPAGPAEQLPCANPDQFVETLFNGDFRLESERGRGRI